MYMEASHIVSHLAVAAGSTDPLPIHNIADFKYGSVQIHGTIQLEVSNDKAIWVNLGGAETTPGITEYNLPNSSELISLLGRRVLSVRR